MTDYLPPAKVGGVGGVVAALRDAYRRMGVKVIVVTTGKQAREEDGVVRIGSGPVALGGASLVLPLFLRRVDLLHVHQASAPGVYLARALLGSRLPPVVTTFHASSREEMRQVRGRRVCGGVTVRPNAREYLYRYLSGPLHRAADQMAARLSDAVTAVSESCLSDCRRIGGGPRWGFWRIPNGVDAGRFRPGAGGDRVRERLGLKDHLVLLYVGTFRLRKGIHDLLVVLREVARARPDVRLLIVGGGRGYEGPLLSLARRLDVQDRVILAGPMENESLPPFYDAADAVLIPSLFEGLPLVLLEAMASARPVVATRVGGIPEVVEDGVTGTLVPPGDPMAMARAVQSVASDPKGASRMGGEARKRVEALYSWDVIARRYLDLFERVCRGHVHHRSEETGRGAAPPRRSAR